MKISTYGSRKSSTEQSAGKSFANSREYQTADYQDPSAKIKMIESFANLANTVIEVHQKIKDTEDANNYNKYNLGFMYDNDKITNELTTNEEKYGNMDSEALRKEYIEQYNDLKTTHSENFNSLPKKYQQQLSSEYDKSFYNSMIKLDETSLQRSRDTSLAILQESLDTNIKKLSETNDQSYFTKIDDAIEVAVNAGAISKKDAIEKKNAAIDEAIYNYWSEQIRTKPVETQKLFAENKVGGLSELDVDKQNALKASAAKEAEEYTTNNSRTTIQNDAIKLAGKNNDGSINYLKAMELLNDTNSNVLKGKNYNSKDVEAVQSNINTLYTVQKKQLDEQDTNKYNLMIDKKLNGTLTFSDIKSQNFSDGFYKTATDLLDKSSEKVNKTTDFTKLVELTKQAYTGKFTDEDGNELDPMTVFDYVGNGISINDAQEVYNLANTVNNNMEKAKLSEYKLKKNTIDAIDKAIDGVQGISMLKQSVKGQNTVDEIKSNIYASIMSEVKTEVGNGANVVDLLTIGSDDEIITKNIKANLPTFNDISSMSTSINNDLSVMNKESKKQLKAEKKAGTYTGKIDDAAIAKRTDEILKSKSKQQTTIQTTNQALRTQAEKELDDEGMLVAGDDAANEKLIQDRMKELSDKNITVTTTTKTSEKVMTKEVAQDYLKKYGTKEKARDAAKKDGYQW